MLPTLLIISAVCFAVIKLQPGSFTDQYLEDPRFTKATVEAITRQLGLDQPAAVQYGRWLWGVVTRLDFGFSFASNAPVDHPDRGAARLDGVYRAADLAALLAGGGAAGHLHRL